MSRTEFSVKTKKAAWDRAAGKCECCGQSFGKHPKERPVYDHRQPCNLGGDNSLENCMCLRLDCHEAKTAGTDMPMIAKARRGEKQRQGIKAKKALIPGSKDSPFKRKISGEVVRR